MKGCCSSGYLCLFCIYIQQLSYIGVAGIPPIKGTQHFRLNVYLHFLLSWNHLYGSSYANMKKNHAY